MGVEQGWPAGKQGWQIPSMQLPLQHWLGTAQGRPLPLRVGGPQKPPLQDVLQHYLDASMNTFVNNQERMQSMVGKAVEDMSPFNPFEEITRQNVAFFEKTMQDFFKNFLDRIAFTLALPAFVAGPLKCDQEADSPHRISAIWTALSAAPLRSWSPETNRQSPLGFERSSRRRPTSTSSWPLASRGMGK